VGSVDTISSYLFEFKWEVGKYFIGQDIKGDRILPNSKLFKPFVNVFSIHDLFTRLPRLFMSRLYYELLKKITMIKLMIWFQGQWRAGLMNHDVFQ